MKPRHERTVSTQLTHKGYEGFLPLYRCRRRHPQRVRESELPLFPGYLFCRFDPMTRLPILTTPGVLHILGFGKQPVPVDESEISAIRQSVDSGLCIEPCPYLKTGQRVLIEDGPLRGVDGILLRTGKKNHLVLSITLLQRSVTVEIEEDLVTSSPN